MMMSMIFGSGDDYSDFNNNLHRKESLYRERERLLWGENIHFVAYISSFQFSAVLYSQML